MNLDDLLDTLDREAKQAGDTARQTLITKVRTNPPSDRAFARLGEAVAARDAERGRARLDAINPGVIVMRHTRPADDALRQATGRRRIDEAEQAIDELLREGIIDKPATPTQRNAEHWRPARWFGAVADDLNAERLRGAARRGMIQSRGKGMKREYSVRSAAEYWPEHAEALRLAIEDADATRIRRT